MQPVLWFRMNLSHPIRFSPYYQSRVWGGRRLETVLRRSLPDASTPFGESWEVSDRAEAMSTTVDGVTLNELWQKHRAEVFGGLKSDSPCFPLLMKILDACDDLSIQVHPPASDETEPRGDLCTRTLAMPADTNANGDIFGGWLLSQMDIAGGVAASKVAKSRTVTVCIDAMNFRKPVYVGDLVSVHANLVRVGRTSMTINVEVYAMRHPANPVVVKVTEAQLTYVAVDADGGKREVPPE